MTLSTVGRYWSVAGFALGARIARTTGFTRESGVAVIARSARDGVANIATESRRARRTITTIFTVQAWETGLAEGTGSPG